jgi:hypothetical protein
VQAPADGYTLLLTAMGNAVNTTLFEKLKYNFLRDIAPVAGISREPLGMEVHPSFPAKTAILGWRQGFQSMPAVINGFSDLILSAFGPERGQHTRSAVGVAELPFGIPVEIEAEVVLD